MLRFGILYRLEDEKYFKEPTGNKTKLLEIIIEAQEEENVPKISGFVQTTMNDQKKAVTNIFFLLDTTLFKDFDSRSFTNKISLYGIKDIAEKQYASSHKTPPLKPIYATKNNKTTDTKKKKRAKLEKRNEFVLKYNNNEVFSEEEIEELEKMAIEEKIQTQKVFIEIPEMPKIVKSSLKAWKGPSVMLKFAKDVLKEGEKLPIPTVVCCKVTFDDAEFLIIPTGVLVFILLTLRKKDEDLKKYIIRKRLSADIKKRSVSSLLKKNEIKKKMKKEINFEVKDTVLSQISGTADSIAPSISRLSETNSSNYSQKKIDGIKKKFLELLEKRRKKYCTEKQKNKAKLTQMEKEYKAKLTQMEKECKHLEKIKCQK